MGVTAARVVGGCLAATGVARVARAGEWAVLNPGSIRHTRSLDGRGDHTRPSQRSRSMSSCLRTRKGWSSSLGAMAVVATAAAARVAAALAAARVEVARATVESTVAVRVVALRARVVVAREVVVAVSLVVAGVAQGVQQVCLVEGRATEAAGRRAKGAAVRARAGAARG